MCWAALGNDASRRSCNQIDIWNIYGCLFGWWAVVNTCCCSHSGFDDAVWKFSLAHASDFAAILLPCKLINRTTFVSKVLLTRHHSSTSARHSVFAAKLISSISSVRYLCRWLESRLHNSLHLICNLLTAETPHRQVTLCDSSESVQYAHSLPRILQ